LAHYWANCPADISDRPQQILTSRSRRDRGSNSASSAGTPLPRTASARRFSRPTAGFIERKGAMYPLSLSVRPDDGPRKRIMTRIAPYVIVASALALSACTNPYDPVQRGLGGGVLGAASGAAIGAAAGGGPGAALGAAIGGATGIFGGVASTPPPPPGTYYGYPAYGYPGYAQPGYGYPGSSGYPAYSGSPGYGYPGYSGQPAFSGPPGYGYPGYSGYPAYPGPPAYGSPSNSGQPAYPGSSGYGYQ
jgi:hypothetical protein